MGRRYPFIFNNFYIFKIMKKKMKLVTTEPTQKNLLRVRIVMS